MDRHGNPIPDISGDDVPTNNNDDTNITGVECNDDEANNANALDEAHNLPLNKDILDNTPESNESKPTEEDVTIRPELEPLNNPAHQRQAEGNTTGVFPG
eukprot:6997625-Ditylum_brightwellii.AAC.1